MTPVETAEAHRRPAAALRAPPLLYECAKLRRRQSGSAPACRRTTPTRLQDA